MQELRRIVVGFLWLLHNLGCWSAMQIDPFLIPIIRARWPQL